LEALRAHLDDLAAGAASLPDVKLLVLGNGRAGKTQICNRLRGDGFERQWNSTHGVQVRSAALAGAAGQDATRLHVWDFGGQDIYHGTHALFVRTVGLFLVVWAADTESSGEYERDGIRFRNHPLQYWVDYVRHQGGAGSPALVIQTKCDTPEDEVAVFPVSAASLADLPYCKTLHYSAKDDRGRAALDEALRDAVGWLRAPGREGVPVVGAGRLKVQRRLEAMRDADALLPPEEKRHRTLGQEEFRLLCEEAGGVGSPEHLLRFLSNAGTVFHREGLFGDRIVLDQAWALDAIYAVFNRQTCYSQLRWLRGRFTRSLLALLVWQDHGVAEQKLFLSMMRSCGICFVHQKRAGEDEAEHIAPDLLPEREEVRQELDEKWPSGAPTETAAFEYALLHPGLVRAVIARIGAEAGVNALYWRGGVCIYEATARSRGLLIRLG
jgi:internalin A